MVLLADFVRSVSESFAILISWLSYRGVQRQPEPVDARYVRTVYGRAGMAVAGVMLISAVLILVGAVAGLRKPTPVANILAGVVVSAGGLVYNVWFWRRYLAIARQDDGILFGTQWRFYRAKAIANASVLVSLATSSLLSRHIWSAYVDIAGSLAVTVFVLVSGAVSATHALDSMR